MEWKVKESRALINRLLCKIIGHKCRVRFREDRPYEDQYYVSMCRRCKALLELKLNYDMTYGDLYLTVEQVFRR